MCGCSLRQRSRTGATAIIWRRRSSFYAKRPPSSAAWGIERGPNASIGGRPGGARSPNPLSIPGEPHCEFHGGSRQGADAGYVRRSDRQLGERQRYPAGLEDGTACPSCQLGYIAEVVASWEPLRERQAEPASPRRPILEVIDGGRQPEPRRAFGQSEHLENWVASTLGQKRLYLLFG